MTHMDRQRPGETKPVYIGDGVYASSDGMHIWLRTQRSHGEVHEIALEDSVFRQLIEYRQDLILKNEE